MNKLVYDRTAEDVEYAKQHQSETSELKGAYNYTDLNRIEEWCEYVANQLNTAGYRVDITTKINWTSADMPTAEEMGRIRSNVEALKNTLNSFTNVPSSLNKMTYKKANDLEKVIEEVHDFIRGIKAFYIYSGVANSGQNMVWQNRFRHDYTPYTRISHIESTGTQYIDTGIKSQVGIRAEILMQFTTEATSYMSPFGSYRNAPTLNFQRTQATYPRWFLNFGDTQTTYVGIEVRPNTTYKIDLYMGTNEQYFKANGDTIYSASEIITGISVDNLYLFRRNSSNPYPASMKLYWCKIFLDDKLVRKFIPVLDDNNVACLYDTVSEELFYNAGTGDFIGG